MHSKQMANRLRSLERRVSPPVVACGTCRGPVPGENMMIFLNDDGHPRYGTCPACGLALTPDGTPMLPHALTPKSPGGWTTFYGASIDWEMI